VSERIECNNGRRGREDEYVRASSGAGVAVAADMVIQFTKEAGELKEKLLIPTFSLSSPSRNSIRLLNTTSSLFSCIETPHLAFRTSASEENDVVASVLRSLLVLFLRHS